MIEGFQIIEKQIHQKIVDELNKISLPHRIFLRTKNDKSLDEKIIRKIREGKPYTEGGKKIQDIIGVRVVTYFQDDINLVKSILKNKLKFIDEEIDEHELTVFKPKRTNIICQFDKHHSEIFEDIKKASSNANFRFVDGTFELQLRTVLSEGWHEIDHSLRYKCKTDWTDHKESERLLNGIYASLETNDIALKNLFSELSYKHFKSQNWEALLRSKFRLQFQTGNLNDRLIEILNRNNSIGKKIIKIDRNEFLLKLCCLDLSLPINFNNLLYLLNFIEINDKEILDITPEIIKNSN
ncbi:hypothetical protein [Zunongwangia sp.]|uniref:hypothetical protein n=1 Tax=Zunongwangia sp. TaxID=1965325 RepID=UPI003AA7B11D